MKNKKNENNSQIEVITKFESGKPDNNNEHHSIQSLKLNETLVLHEHSGNLYANLYDYSPVGLLTLEDKGIIQNLNLKLASMLGIERKNIPGIPFLVYVAKENIQHYLKYLKKLNSTHENDIIEFSLISRNGETIIVEMHSTLVTDYKSGKNLIQNTIIDISARKIAESNHQESESRFRVMADNAPVLIWMVGTNGKINYLNKQFLEFTGKSMEAGLGDGLTILVHQDDVEECLRKFQSAFEKKEEFKLSYRVLDANVEYRWLLGHGIPRFTNNEFVGYIGSAIDITEQKDFEQKQEKALKEKIVLMKEIHHRVKNNLQIISSLLNLQLSKYNNTEIEEALLTSKNRIRTMTLIHENLYKSDNIAEVQFDIYLNDLINNIFETYRKYDHKINLTKNIEEIFVDADTAIYIGLILNELLTNSLKFAFHESKKGSINLELKMLEGKKRQLVVSDDGAGFPVGFNMNESKTLGLMLVNNLIDQMKGSLAITSNNGTSFRITF
jgi:PAS domain S-box-containing protein